MIRINLMLSTCLVYFERFRNRLLQVEEQQVLIATMTVDWWQCRTNRDSLVPIRELIHQLES